MMSAGRAVSHISSRFNTLNTPLIWQSGLISRAIYSKQLCNDWANSARWLRLCAMTESSRTVNKWTSRWDLRFITCWLNYDSWYISMPQWLFSDTRIHLSSFIHHFITTIPTLPLCTFQCLKKYSNTVNNYLLKEGVSNHTVYHNIKVMSPFFLLNVCFLFYFVNCILMCHGFLSFCLYLNLCLPVFH